MTRPRAASEAFVARLSRDVANRITPIYSPLIDIVGIGADFEIARDHGVIFTSGNGVRHAPHGTGQVAYCVGRATTELAQSRGWTAQQAGGDAQSLIEQIIRIHPTQRLFHLSGTYTRGNVVDQLRSAGLKVERRAVYDQPLHPLSNDAHAIMQSAPFVCVPLFSPRTATQFAEHVIHPSSVHIIALSAAVAEPLRGLGIASVTNAARPDADAMRTAIASVV
ncbi:uroporphyrinogen-III synthase [uncultured Tateyamaria sp.]|uniref:uroporphyrinogen-III synthase n=1 Tax=uncultured Tateyamaria sp. TaxID=455651 RepID=UPI00260D4E81|nr:uroporphyrinogen-III synthase [uncultured Tateyamaria sp.]